MKKKQFITFLFILILYFQFNMHALAQSPKNHGILLLPGYLLNLNVPPFDKFIFIYRRSFLGPILLEGGTYTSTNKPISKIDAYKLSRLKGSEKEEQLNYGKKISELYLTKKDINDYGLVNTKNYVLVPDHNKKDYRYVSYDIYELNDYINKNEIILVAKGRIDPCPPCK